MGEGGKLYGFYNWNKILYISKIFEKIFTKFSDLNKKILALLFFKYKFQLFGR